MEIRHPEIGVCGLSCVLCPRFHTDGPSRCSGCKGEQRMAAGCPFITCAVKRRGIEFCWDCDESGTCEKWAKHREAGRVHDSFVSYAALDDSIELVGRVGLDAFIAEAALRAALLDEMLAGYDEGRSKSYYCVAATLLGPDELRSALDSVRTSDGETSRDRAKMLHAALEAIAGSRSLRIALRR